MRHRHTSAALLLLGLLRQQRMHGYRLHEFIDRDLASCANIKRPTAYLLLERMARDGWIATRTRSSGNRPPRREYRVTREGERAFQQLVRENLEAFVRPQFPGDVGLVFLDALPAQEARELLDRRRRAMAAAHAHLAGVDGHHGGAGLVVDHLAHHLESELTWIDRVLARLPRRPGARQRKAGRA